MKRPIFFKSGEIYYNVEHIVSFSIENYNYNITMSNGKVVIVPTASLKLHELIYLANDYSDDKYKIAKKI